MSKRRRKPNVRPASTVQLARPGVPWWSYLIPLVIPFVQWWLAHQH